MQTKAVIFDAFGTLLKIQNGQHPYRRLIKLGQANGRRPHSDDVRVLMQMPISLTEAADRLGISAPKAELDSLEQLLADEIAAIEPFSDGLAAVAMLQRHRVRVGVCSNLAHPYCEAILRNYPGMDAYAFSCEVGAMKPDVKIYRETCNLLAASPLTTSMIGDSLRCDRDGPRTFGINGFYLDRARGMGDYAELVEFALDVLHNADN